MLADFFSIRWAFVTTALKRFLPLLIFIFIVKSISREDIGSYSIFIVFVSVFSNLAIFKLDKYYLSDETKKSSLPLSLMILFFSIGLGIIFSSLSGILGNLYQSKVFYQLLKWGVPIILIESFRSFTKTILIKNKQYSEIYFSEFVNSILYTIMAVLVLTINPSIDRFVLIYYLGSLSELLILLIYINMSGDRIKLKKMFFRLFFSFRSGLDKVKKSFISLILSNLSSLLKLLILEFPILFFGLYYSLDHIGNYLIAYLLVTFPIVFFAGGTNQISLSRLVVTNKSEFFSQLSRYFYFVFRVVAPFLLLFILILREWLEPIFGKSNIREIKIIMLMLFFRAILCLVIEPLGRIFIYIKKSHIGYIWVVSSLIILLAILHLFKDFGFITLMSMYLLICTIIFFSYFILVFKQLNFLIGNFIKQFFLFISSTLILITLWNIIHFSINVQGVYLRAILFSLAGVIVSLFYILYLKKTTKIRIHEVILEVLNSRNQEK